MEIDRTTYLKTTRMKVGLGYDRRPDKADPQSIIIHTTNGNRGSSFEGEANYLANSLKVSAHYLVGKRGQLVEILPPEFRAWHAGAVKAFYYNNAHSIGIECHHAVGDTWWSVQKDALTWLVGQLMMQYNIPSEMVVTHRSVAVPAGRKEDPSDWPDLLFSRWQQLLGSDVDPDFRFSHDLSGGVWKVNQLTPGLAKGHAFMYGGKKRQRFERGVATLEPTGEVSWMLLEEILNANFPS